MTQLKKIYITGYRNYELGIFQENDPKIQILKNVLKKEIIQLIEEGVEWFLIGGNLGVELWGAAVLAELKAAYTEISFGVLFPFAEFGSSWNEKNTTLLQLAKSVADYQGYVSNKSYYTPSQLKNHTNFILQHTDGCLMIYDQEYPGKCEYLLKDIRSYQEKYPYSLRLITMDDLQNSMDN